MSISEKSSSLEQQRAEEKIFTLVEKELNITLEKNPTLYLSNNKYTYIKPDFYSAEHHIICEIFAHIGKPKKAQDNKIEASVGLTEDGSYSKPSNTNYIGNASTVMGAIVALDSALKTHEDSNEVSFRNEATNRNNAITAAINGLNINNYATVSALDAVEAKVDAIGRITEEEIANLLAS